MPETGYCRSPNTCSSSKNLRPRSQDSSLLPTELRSRCALHWMIRGLHADLKPINVGCRWKAGSNFRRSPSSFLAEWRMHRAARQVAAIRGVIMPSQHTDHSDLCWRLSFGRTGSQVSVVEGRKHIRRGVRRAIADCDVLLQESARGLHHLGRSIAIGASSPIMRPAWDNRSPKARCAKEMFFLQDCCVAVIAAASHKPITHSLVLV